MTIKTKLLIGFLSIVTIILISGLLSIAEINLLHKESRNVGVKTGPLVDATMEIKQSITTAHLWFEEILTGTEAKEQITKVWNLFEKSLWYADAIVHGGENEEGVFYAVEDQVIEKKVYLIKDQLKEFQTLAQHRFDNKFTEHKQEDQILDDQFDALFDKLTQTVDAVEEILQAKNQEGNRKVENVANRATIIITVAVCLSLLLASLAIYYLSRDILTQIGGEPAEIAKITEQVATGNLNIQLETSRTATGIYAAIQLMVKQLRQITTDRDQQDWIKTGQTQLNELMRGEPDVMTLTQNVINFVASYLKAAVGAFYLAQHDHFKLITSYAYKIRNHNDTEFKLGEGLVGQAALEKKSIVYTHLPSQHLHLTINSGLEEVHPITTFVLPLVLEGNVLGVLEIGSSNDFTGTEIEFLDRITNDIAITLNTAHSRVRMQELLAESQSQQQALQTQQDQLQTQNEELHTQQEELQAQNEELQAQQEELQTQQEELRHANEELEERAHELEKQKEEVREKNRGLETTQHTIEAKAKELELASRYKSEFLANMSHELRTPLNSMLILSQLLVENKHGNLDNKQIEYAKTICSAGTDLLTIINDILDLSKVEAGKLDIQREDVLLSELVESLEQKFRPLADEKGLHFKITTASEMPLILNTDPQRLKQILNNLLSNAFKFTAQGHVQLEITANVQNLSFAVSDTGIGIPKDKQEVIFGAFQQADGSTSRRYGGTGLGLTISRQLARLLGGDIQLHSEAGQGSTFTLSLPNTSAKSTTESTKSFASSLPPQADHSPQISPPVVSEETKVVTDETKHEVSPACQDDRDLLQPEDRKLLIVEDDNKFAKVLLEIGHDKHFKCLLAEDGQKGLQLAFEYQPQAIILDVGLPKLDGWSVLEKLKQHPQTRHIPVHFMSAYDHRKEAKQMGAIGYLLKPINMEQLGQAFKKIERFISNHVKNLLIFSGHEHRQRDILSLVADTGIQIKVATTRIEAFQQLYITAYDCLILDLDIEQGGGASFLELFSKDENLSQIPVIIYAERELTLLEQQIVHDCENNLTLKEVRSPERLLEEVTLFLHQVEANLSKEKRQMLQMVHNKEVILKNKKVLIVDDDTRNTFALFTVLEEKDMEVLVAEHGKEALGLLTENPNVDIVLMDIMMPEMDGYEAIQKIRAQPQFRKLPIIALTAKAMKGDKAKCIEAGANDYLSKPVDLDKLFSLMRVWLYR